MGARIHRRELLGLAAGTAASLVMPGTIASSSAAVGPRAAGPLSGLSWNSGAFTKADQLATFRGRPCDIYGSFVSHDTWEQIAGFPYNTSFPTFVQKPVWISLGYPLVPKSVGSVSPTMWTQLATPGNSVFNDFYARHEQLARNIGTLMASSRRRCRGVIARVGWEFNGSHPWELTDFTKAPQYLYVFRKLVEILRRNIPGIVIEWNPLRRGKQKSLPIMSLFPGKSYVDIVSICQYDRLPAYNSRAIWDAQYNRLDDWGNPWGIGAWLNFAKQQNLLFAVPEWGLANGMKYANDSVDNPLYMDLMFNFFRQNAQYIAYETYFNNVYYHQIVPSIRNPKGAAAYRALYSRGG